MRSTKNIYNKLPKTPEDHLAQLKQRGLKIEDESRAIRYLSHIGYYRLSAYFIPFEQKDVTLVRNHNFQENTNFEQILGLYIFDRKLRILIMEAIERIEVSIRANWANAITLFSNNSHAYIDSTLFKDPWAHHKNLSFVVNRLAESEEIFVKHYKNNYSQPFLPPTWAMVETLSFGQISKWYSDTKSTDVKKQVMHSFGMPTIEITENVMECLSLVRNICAHHGRVWNRKIVKQLHTIKKFKSEMVFEEVKTDKGIQNQSSRKLYNYLWVMTFLMKKLQPNTSWPERLDKLINTLPLKHRAEMGITTKWIGFDGVKIY